MSDAQYSAYESIQLAVHIEENGYAFYTAVAKTTENKKIASVLSKLAEQELEHKRIFESFIRESNAGIVFEPSSQEYDAYMRAFSQEYLFTEKILRKKMAEGFQNTSEVLSFAIGLEKDSIIFYEQIRSGISDERKILDTIIEEETKHFVILNDLRKFLIGEEDV